MLAMQLFSQENERNLILPVPSVHRIYVSQPYIGRSLDIVICSSLGLKEFPGLCSTCVGLGNFMMSMCLYICSMVWFIQTQNDFHSSIEWSVDLAL